MAERLISVTRCLAGDDEYNAGDLSHRSHTVRYASKHGTISRALRPKRIGVMFGPGRLIGRRGYPPVSVLCRYVTWNENKNRDLSLIETKLGGDPEKHQLRIKTNSA